MFKKVLIANRGEIALRVIRACKELGLATVAVHSTADAESLHVRFADEAICIGPPQSKQSYLNVRALLSAAEITGADAIHPGYGFLSENAEFAEMVTRMGLKFIGPRPEMIRLMGNKVAAREAMEKAGLPLLPGARGKLADADEAERIAEEVGFPVILKAAAGGGGRGMKICRDRAPGPPAVRDREQRGAGRVRRRLDVPRALRRAAAPHRAADRRRRARQHHPPRRARVLGPAAPPEAHRGGAVARRSRPRCAREMGEVALGAMRKIGYNNVGTIEFLLDEKGRYYFMEMNTRIQVEHPVTEQVYRLDLLREQIRLAAGEPLERTQDVGRPAARTPSSAASTPRTRSPSRPRPARSPATTSPAATACGSTRWRTSSTRCSPTTTRWSPSSSSPARPARSR